MADEENLEELAVNKLPEHILEHIFGYCDSSHKFKMGLVCARWALATESLLLKRTCLKISHVNRFEQTLMLDRSVLEQSSRRYRALQVEWGDNESQQTMTMLHQLLDICQEQFSVQRLYIRGTPDEKLVQFFEDRRTWLNDLLELHVKLVPPNNGKPTNGAFYRVSLPKLQKLTWFEIEKEDPLPGILGDPVPIASFEEWYAFVVKAPMLSHLKVQVKNEPERRHLIRRSYVEDICELFMPSLELQTFEENKLKMIEIEGLLEVNPLRMASSTRLLQSLDVLSFVKCTSIVIVDICYKSCNIRELSIEDGMGDQIPLRIIQTICPVLEKFTFRGSYHMFIHDHDHGTFPMLRYLKIEQKTIGVYVANIRLTTPLLTTFIAPKPGYCQVILLHDEQVRTMAIELDSMRKDLTPPPPNVTELFLRMSSQSGECISLTKYLGMFPSLQRLTLAGTGKPVVDGAFLVNTFRHLKYFHAHRLWLNLSDIHALRSLQSIILTECTIEMHPRDNGNPVTVENDFRAELVTIEVANGKGADGQNVDSFPIVTSDRQPPVELVEITNDDQQRQNVFSNPNFHMRLPEEFQHIVEEREIDL